MNLGTIKSRARSYLNEPTASYWSDSEVEGWINDGLEEIEIDSFTTEDVRSMSTVENQQEYGLPDKVLKVVEGIRWEDNPLNWCDWEDYVRVIAPQNMSVTGDPTDCMVYDRKIYLHPRPSDSASQATLSSSMTSSSASMLVDSTTGFPDTGRFIVGSEVVAYTGRSATKFSGLSRAMEDTSATSHIADVLATERDITYPCKVVSATLSDDSDTPEFTGLHKTLAYYVAREGWSKKGDKERVEYFDKRWEKGKADIKKFSLRQLYGRQHVKDSDVYGKRRF